MEWTAKYAGDGGIDNSTENRIQYVDFVDDTGKTVGTFYCRDTKEGIMEKGEMIARGVSAEKQLADLRGDRDTLAGEVEARRDKSISIGPASSSMGPYREAYWKLEAAIIKTDASGALTRAGKDHP